MKHPKFGDKLRNMDASEDNPLQDGFFVRRGWRAEWHWNPGTYYEITDGEGAFWEVKPELLAPLSGEWCPFCDGDHGGKSCPNVVGPCSTCGGTGKVGRHDGVRLRALPCPDCGGALDTSGRCMTGGD